MFAYLYCTDCVSFGRSIYSACILLKSHFWGYSAPYYEIAHFLKQDAQEQRGSSALIERICTSEKNLIWLRGLLSPITQLDLMIVSS
jgi:hypothetical protein